MWGILLSAVNTAMGFIFRTVIIKFALFFGLFFVVHELVPVLASWLPDGANLTAAFGAQTPHVWYFLDLFEIAAGVSMLLSAWVTRFIIRRIPLIG
ncbi:DUF2523 domain-containing protein [Oceanimonas baumannii]|uniref:DUF2523 family protein n=1 Tax=Oceanimonas baumannii TaxID=129578 RepID=UPI001D17D645|nr:DUF2523 family protein [Oceanimonas baumannii]MCC4266175.1 DUF2523 domain-containing protein [Oceanimonas baumannii]